MIKSPHAQWSNLTNYSPHEARAEDATSSSSRRKLVPLSFLAKGKFRCQIVWTFPFFPHWRTDGRTDRHFIMSRRAAVADRLGLEACGMWHAAFTNWNAAVSVEKVNEANRKPQTTDQSAVLLTAEGPANPASLEKKKNKFQIRREKKRVTAFCLFFSFPPPLHFTFFFILNFEWWRILYLTFVRCATPSAVDKYLA